MELKTISLILFHLLASVLARNFKPLNVSVHGSSRNSHLIVGGEDAEIEDFPYQVAVLLVDEIYCGGSLVSLEHVVTAAHCLRDENGNPIDVRDVFIRAGSSIGNQGGQYVSVGKAIEHPNYDVSSSDYDVGVLVLEKELTAGAGVSPVDLNSQSPVPEHQNAAATGWGRLSENGPIPQQLQKVTLPTISKENCRIVYGDEAISDRMLCAGYPEGGKDTCQGDSGGPLAIANTLIGITSWGDGCGQENSPGIYTDVASVSSFIEETMQNNP